MKKLLLVDGNSVLFRSYYSTAYTNPMSTSAGLSTNGVYGFIATLNKIVRTIEPDALLVAFDAGQKTFRHDMMEEYKGTRKPLEPELLEQMPVVREFLDEANIVRYEQPGYEADDIIGSAAKAALDMETYILTGDQDLLQLVDDSTTVLMMKKGLSFPERFTPAKVEEVYGLKPLQIIDLKGLMGDASDNIPGVKGVGIKTAQKLLNEYGSVENTYAHIDDLKGALKKKMEAGKESAFLSKELATIFTSMELPFSFDDLEYQPDQDRQANFYLKYEMQSLLAGLKSTAPRKTYSLETVSSLPAGENGLDFEKPIFLLPLANNLPFMEQTLFGFCVGQQDHLYYIEWKPALADEGFKKVLASKQLDTWNAKKAWHLLNRYGFDLPDFRYDLHLAAFLLYSQATSTEGLLKVLEIDLPFPLRDLEKKSLGGFTPERAAPLYAAWLAQAMEKVEPTRKQLEEEELHELYYNVEFPLARILFEMEREGISINAQVLEEIGKEYQQIMSGLEEKIFAFSGHSFNIGSPKQLGAVLFDELKLKNTKKRSTAADVLEKLQSEHPIIPLILEYRKYSKIVSTYVEGLSKAIIDGKIHTTFNQTMAQTGRLSSSEPNLQNISIKSDEGKEIRKAFIAPKGYVFLSADYSQIELRMLAHMANEQFMIQAFDQGIDIHNRTASLIFNVQPDEVTSAQRRIAKTVNFAIIYGQTEFGLATELKIDRNEAKKFISAYFASYPRIHGFTDGLVEFCEEHGYVKTLLNRRRTIPEIHDKNFMVRAGGKRQAMNAPIQGSAADLIKVAMIQVDQKLKENKLESKMLLQIHDELIFLVPEEELEIMRRIVPETMDHAMELNVPLEVDVSYGQSWYEAK